MSKNITIRPWDKNPDTDFEFMFTAFNSCIEWLASRGMEAQWGAQPWGNDIKEKLRSRIPSEDEQGAKRWIAEVDGESAGCLVAGPIRPYYLPATAEDKAGKEMYVEILVVHRKFTGCGVGEALPNLAKKYAAEEKADWLRLDCYRGPEGKDGLVRYYESQGFLRARQFDSPKHGEPDWPGQLLEIKMNV